MNKESENQYQYLYLMDKGGSNRTFFKTLEDVLKCEPSYEFIKTLIENQIEEFGETTLADNTTIYKLRVYGLVNLTQLELSLNFCVSIGKLCLATSKFLEENDIHQILQREFINVVPVSAKFYNQ